MSDLVVDIQNLSRTFGRTQALQGVTLQVPRGGVFGLIGSNGAGKTTLIKHILYNGGALCAERIGQRLWSESSRRTGQSAWTNRIHVGSSRCASLDAGP